MVVKPSFVLCDKLMSLSGMNVAAYDENATVNINVINAAIVDTLIVFMLLVMVSIEGIGPPSFLLPKQVPYH